VEPGLEPKNYKFGGGATESVLHPIVLVAMILAVILIFLLPRKNLVVVFLFATFLVPGGQEFLVAGVHVFVFRVIVLAGLIRMVWTKISSNQRVLGTPWNSIDTTFLLFVVFHSIAFSLLYKEVAALVNQFGMIWDFLGGYFLLRYLIKDEADIRRAINCFAILAAIMAICMIREQLTGQNIFGLLGGVRLESEIREGRIRSEAVFQHSILAGTFGAVLFPLFAWLWKNGNAKLLSAIGAVSSIIMTVTCFSSTPALGLVAGILGMCFWPLRKHMKLVRWTIVVALLALSAVMKAPVWFLIAHVAVLGGSSAYHRADLVDTFIRHIGDWWLLGTAHNSSWGYFMFDTSNAYVAEGVTGGLFALIFFIATISRSFARVGSARRIVEKDDRKAEWLLWFLGCAVFANAVAFFGISYFDQTKVAWFALLAMVSAATATYLNQPVRLPVAIGGPGIASSNTRWSQQSADFRYDTPARVIPKR
jgi:hypothetical protein